MAINEFGAPRWQSEYLLDGRSIGDAILDARSKSLDTHFAAHLM